MLDVFIRSNRKSANDEMNIQFGMVIIPTKPLPPTNLRLRMVKAAYKSAFPSG